jgi:quercetin dioxygenase-like cupin family protein
MFETLLMDKSIKDKISIIENNIEKLREISENVFKFSEMSHLKGDSVVYDTITGSCIGFRLMHTPLVAVQYAEMSKDSDLICHSHEEVEYLIVYKGALEIEIGGITKILLPGSSIELPPRTPHHVKSETGCKMIAITIPASEYYPKGE